MNTFLLVTTLLASEATLVVADNTTTTTTTTTARRELVYDALRSLNPNTLNITIYWHCISKSYTHLSEFGDFQKNDANYQKCKAEGHLLYERSCLHNLLVPSNCFTGKWKCESIWLNNIDYAVKWIKNTASAWPQCFTSYSSAKNYSLTWDCEEGCDLPCSYPKEFCTTIKKSYNSTLCELKCKSEDRRLQQPDDRRLSAGPSMQLKFGSGGELAAAAPTSTPKPTTVAPAIVTKLTTVAPAIVTKLTTVAPKPQTSGETSGEASSSASAIKIAFLSLMGLLAML